MAAGFQIPTVRLRFRLEGEIIIDRLLSGISERATNLAPAWPGVLEAFYRITAAAFSSEGASTGAPWKALAKSTQAERKRLGYGPSHPILRRTGALEDALTGKGGGVANASGSQLMFTVEGEAGKYFKYHQSLRPRRRLPRRAPVLLTGDDQYALLRPVRLYLTGRAEGVS